jgi:hypothetical protein
VWKLAASCMRNPFVDVAGLVDRLDREHAVPEVVEERVS